LRSFAVAGLRVSRFRQLTPQRSINSKCPPREKDDNSEQ
jgi:hypothetical protein